MNRYRRNDSKNMFLESNGQNKNILTPKTLNPKF